MGGGAFRNLHLCDGQTLGVLVFIFKTCSDQILAKLINQGGYCCSFLIKTSKKFDNEKIFLCLKIAKIYMGVNFGSRRTILDIKTRFFLKLTNFSGGKYPKSMPHSLLQREIL